MLHGRRTTTLLLCSMYLAITALSFSQEARETIFRVSVDLVQVDAVVTNSKDEPVTNLSAEDFEILQDGVPQKITHFSFVRTIDVMPPVSKAPDSKKDARSALPAPPMPINRERVCRTIALVADDLALSGEYAARLRQWIRKWLDEEMQLNDHAMKVLVVFGSASDLVKFLPAAIYLIIFQPVFSFLDVQQRPRG
jgi:VWFA-related protein